MNIDYNFQQPNNYKQKRLFINSTTPNARLTNVPKTSDKTPEFGNAASSAVELNKAEKFLNFLSTDMAWGAVLIDLVSMVIPRTFIDFRRDPKAGAETAARESAGSVNHSLIGVYGALAGLMFTQGLNKTFNIKANNIYTDNLTADTYKNILVEQSKAGKMSEKDFIVSALKSYDTPKFDKNQEISSELVNSLSEMISSDKKPDKTLKKSAIDELIKLFRAEDGIVLKSGNEVNQYSAKNIVDNIVTIGKTIKNDKITANPDSIENFFKSLKKMNGRRSWVGLLIGSAIGASVQPLNVYLTKKRTGHSGFVGGGEEDNSTGFKVRKTLIGLLFGSGVIASIGKLKDLTKNIQFQGKTPTIPQFKFIYGMTIVSRFLAARNDYELKESLVKDFLGFLNWLVLGSFVQKGVAKALDKDLVEGKNFIKGKLTTRKEVLFSDLADNVKKTKLRKLTIAQLSGYLYSIIVLGTLVPKLNIWMTNRRLKKKKEAEMAEHSQVQQQNAKQTQQVSPIKIQNINFERNDTIKKFYSTNTVNYSLSNEN